MRRNIGSMLAGLSTIAIALGALIRGPAAVRAWIDRQGADAEEARARAEALRADVEERRLERRRTPAWLVAGRRGNARGGAGHRPG